MGSMREVIEKRKEIQESRTSTGEIITKKRDMSNMMMVISDALSDSVATTYKIREDFIVESLGELYNTAKEVREELGMGDKIPPSSRDISIIAGVEPKAPEELQGDLSKRIANEVAKQLIVTGIDKIYVGVDLAADEKGKIEMSKQTEVEKIWEKTELISHYAKQLENRYPKDSLVAMIAALVNSNCDDINKIASKLDSSDKDETDPLYRMINADNKRNAMIANKIKSYVCKKLSQLKG